MDKEYEAMSDMYLICHLQKELRSLYIASYALLMSYYQQFEKHIDNPIVAEVNRYMNCDTFSLEALKSI